MARRARTPAELNHEVSRLLARNEELQGVLADIEEQNANLRFELLHKDRERRFWAAMFHAAKTYVAHAIKQEDMMGKDPG
jgi:hypothetical protein